MKVGRNVVVWAEEKREMNPDEEYFVAKIEERGKRQIRMKSTVLLNSKG